MGYVKLQSLLMALSVELHDDAFPCVVLEATGSPQNISRYVENPG